MNVVVVLLATLSTSSQTNAHVATICFASLTHKEPTLFPPNVVEQSIASPPSSCKWCVTILPNNL